MKKLSLGKKGLSMSDAQSMSNLCNQKVLDIDKELNAINLAEKTVTVNEKVHILEKGNSIPANIVELLTEKGDLCALQAFLMENIKGKEELLTNIKKSQPDFSLLDYPVRESDDTFDLLSPVTEEWAWSKLSITEVNEFYKYEALASSIGKFIHKSSKLDQLRNSISTLPTIEWIEIEKDKKTPVTITPNTDSLHLYQIHEKLSLLHKEYERKVNYYKAKVKNLVTEENSRIASENSLLRDKYNVLKKEKEQKFHSELTEYNKKCSEIISKFEIERQQSIKDISNLKIVVDPMFQTTVDKLNFLGK